MPRKAGLNATRAKKKKVVATEVPTALPLPATVLTRLVKEHFPTLPPLFPATAQPEQQSQAAVTGAPDKQVPASPGMRQWREAELAAQMATNQVRIARQKLCKSGRDFLSASNLHDLKLKRIDRAQKRKLAPHKVLNKLWDADTALRVSERHMLRMKYEWAAASHDAQAAINAAQVVRIRRLKRFLRSAKQSELKKVGS